MPLNATAASLLGFLHDGPLTGWDLVATAQQRIGAFWSITQSQVYRELTAMAGDGLVEAGERGARDRRPYAITDKGREAFATWVAELPAPEMIRFPLLLTVQFGAHVPRETLAAHVSHHRAAHAQRLAGYEASRAAADACSTLCVEYPTIISTPNSKRAACGGMSSCPRCTPSAPAASATSARSLTINFAPNERATRKASETSA